MRRRLLLASITIAAAIGATTFGCNAPRISNGATGTQSASPTATDTGATPTPTGTLSLCSSTGTTDAQGGTLDCLSFAIVGDTRPATINDTGSYPTTIINKIYQDLQSADGGRPSFALSSGDYVYASTSGSEAAAQLDLYLQAQTAYSGVVYHAMGNHECTGYTNSNCATGTSSNNNYNSFVNRMLTPMGYTKPYFALHFHAPDDSWTAKFVFVAANAWDSTQQSWLENEMSQSTTYTFVVRHEGIYANTAPGVDPSQSVISQHPYTMLLEGHTHTFAYYANDREVIAGNGGAPLTGSVNYGYVLVRQRSDGAIDFRAVDYQSGATIKHFVVTKDGGATN